ncbi:MAG: radical SAM protein [Nanoarchaeota archaeon]|nr:radical SAM protein [DPANN group archaeon]MBL7116585.1 radical SAM protein [Nanoarchaeota archaeon]
MTNIERNIATLYTCLYITNECINDCGYCGFRKSNDNLERITLTENEIREEAIAIRESGVRNAIIIGGTLPEGDYKDLILASTETAVEENLIPWIEFENLSYETLKELHDIGSDHFVLFQETYNRELYGKLHKKSPLKNDYDLRLQKIDEAIEAGFSNIGIGALFGLNKNYTFEVEELCKHTENLQDKGVNVIVSVPALNQANISSEELYKITSQIRIALSGVSIALSGRERHRDALFSLTEYIGTGGVTFPGGRTIHKGSEEVLKQFDLGDTRTPKEIIDLLKSLNIEVK